MGQGGDGDVDDEKDDDDDDDDGDVISTLQDRMAPPAIALGAARDTPSDMNAL